MAPVDSKKQEVKYTQLELELYLPDELPPPNVATTAAAESIAVFDTAECEWIQL